MVCYLTSKRMTYLLIIRQLRFDKYDFVASELERLFFNSLGNLDRSNLPPSDQLQKMVGSNSICSEIITDAQSSLDTFLKSAATYENVLRRPKSLSSLVDESAVVVSQDNVCSPIAIYTTTDLTADTLMNPASSSASSNHDLLEEVPQSLKVRRGRAISAKSLSTSSLSISSQDEPTVNLSDSYPTEDIVEELQNISQELRNGDEFSQEKSTINSFLSVSDPNKAENSQLNVNESIHQPQGVAQSEPKVHDMLKPENLPSSYTKYKIVKIDSDEDDEGVDDILRTDSQTTDDLNKSKMAPSLSNDSVCTSSHKTTNSQVREFNVSNFLESVSGQRSKFRQYGKSEDFANCPNEQSLSSAKAVPRRDSPSNATNPPINPYCEPVQNNRVDSYSSRKTPAHRLSNNTELLQFDNSSKARVLSILAEGWTVHVVFEKRVRKEIPRAGKSSLEEILYAVFGSEASSFVEFKTEKNKMHVRLIPSYKTENFDNIFAMLEGSL